MYGFTIRQLKEIPDTHDDHFLVLKVELEGLGSVGSRSVKTVIFYDNEHVPQVADDEVLLEITLT